jgi:DNA-directed RNA polymerase specialized sigma24 family protein
MQQPRQPTSGWIRCPRKVRSIGQFDRNKAAFKTWLLLFAYHRTLNRRRAMVTAQLFRTESLDEFMPELLTRAALAPPDQPGSCRE